MKVKWLGHACFVITSASGARIITDPYEPVNGINYKPLNESADVVTVSHEHFDHSNARAVKGNPQVLKGPGVRDIKGVRFNGVAAYHDENQGKQRGPVTVFCFNPDGINVCHLGDLGQKLSPEQIAEIGKVDVLLAPVGGFYTVDAKAANEICGQLHPRVVIPMHYKTDRIGLPINTADEFVQLRPNVRTLDASEVEFRADSLPSNETILLKHAM